ncbi:PBP1A family penicillin-binding protein [Blautia wexlerae]|jgi:penicillin-binding protein 1A|uniref:transglycosylase domain-containing protein n=1 Tax=Blautia wexlerae TaxID=418240 RepID=UPI00156EFECE|nr:PBP1A family penicillin-binding protein [Blautia wexlerae]NSF65141.1 PBP1A family penicillin-binding protein [Blautia wexlerae]
MNYGKKSTAKKRTALISRSSMMGKRARVSFIRVLFVSLIALCIAVTCLGVGSFRGVIDTAPDVDDIDIMPLGYATFLYDDAGNQIRKLAAPDSNRLPVTLDQIPVDLQHAVVAIEDERFYEHNGIDVKGILRAGMKALTTGDFSEGASTITQQLLKNNVFTNWTSESTQLERFTRKIQEQYLAVQVEKKTDKDTILENYLNTINLGAGSYGVQAAARQYFDKDVWDLNLSECATLAGITQNPTKFNPIINPDSNRKRRKEVLQHMLDQNYITQDQYDEALADDVYSRIQAAQEKNSSTENTVYTYFEDELTDQIINDLMNIKGYTKKQATNLLYSGGLKVYTTQDSKIQNILDEEYADPSNYPDTVQYELDYALTVTDPDGNQVNYSKEMLQLYFQNEDPDFDLLFDSPEDGQTYVDKYKASILANGSKVLAERVNFAPQPQSSMSVIDQHTGYVKALIGGRGEKTASLTLNRATDTTRQPGSTFKIVSTYAPALNEKGMTLATTFEDEPYEYPDGSPVNNATRSYNGTTTIRTAIQNSINVVAVKCLEKVTPELGLKYLDNFGFTTLAHGTEADKDANGNVWSDANLATALGGITRGVTNVELCASYAAIANGGNYIKPIYYTKILDHNGNVLIENTAAERSVIKESTAFLLTSAMEDVVKQGTGTACQLDNMPVAGKTGTTEAYNDLWFVGYTPYYTCAVWSGYDNNEKLPDYARNFHKALWKKVMSRIHEGLPSKEFEKPASVEKLSVCEETGLLPRAGCPVITEYFDVGTMPTEYCDQHFYGSNDDYDYNYDADSSDQTDNTTDTDNSENSDNGDTDNSGDSNNTDDNGNSGDDGTDNTGGSDDNGDGNEDDSSYQVDYY